jgi:hypothetical protein
MGTVTSKVTIYNGVWNRMTRDYQRMLLSYNHNNLKVQENKIILSVDVDYMGSLLRNISHKYKIMHRVKNSWMTGWDRDSQNILVEL